tara:strand:+ start:154 stop:357 length:204 start_codon:yes stop_codon:yes gene_type:complete
MSYNEIEAVLEYGNGNFNVIKHGTYVVCSVTKKKIPLSELKYWSVERQEPYLDAETSFIRENEINSG